MYMCNTTWRVPRRRFSRKQVFLMWHLLLAVASERWNRTALRTQCYGRPTKDIVWYAYCLRLKHGSVCKFVVWCDSGSEPFPKNAREALTHTHTHTHTTVTALQTNALGALNHRPKGTAKLVVLYGFFFSFLGRGEHLGKDPLLLLAAWTRTWLDWTGFDSGRPSWLAPPRPTIHFTFVFFSLLPFAGIGKGRGRGRGIGKRWVPV